jgi:excisionase family DNA binding protein
VSTYDDVPVVLDVRQAASVLNCSERLVRTMIASGELGHVRLHRLVRVPRHQLLKLLHANESGPAKDGAANTTTPNVSEGDRRAQL